MSEKSENVVSTNGIKSSDRKIVICTQSNVAVDVILSRYLKDWDKFGFKSYDQVMNNILRITSLEYQPSDKELLKVTFNGKYDIKYP